MAANADEMELELLMQRMENLKMDDAPPDSDAILPRAAAAEAENAVVGTVPPTRAQWTALLLDHMYAAVDADDAAARADELLEAFERSVSEAARAERSAIVSENSLFKRAFRVQHRMLMAEKAAKPMLQSQIAGFQESVTRLEKERGTLSMHLRQKQKQVAKLEKENYTLAMHLRQAQKPGSSMPGYFHPGIF